MLGVTFTQIGAPLVVVRKSETFTPTAEFDPVDHDVVTCRLKSTTTGNVLSPGGAELGAGPDPRVENDDLQLTFDSPVNAVGFDIIYQLADGSSSTSITVKDVDGRTLFDQEITAPATGCGRSQFIGLVSGSNNIKTIIVNEQDDDAEDINSNIGYDTIRLKFKFDLDVDTDRDGEVDDVDDEEDEEKWSKTRGAIYMVNFDDDDGNGIPDGGKFIGKFIVKDGMTEDEESRIIKNEDDAKDISQIVFRTVIDETAASDNRLEVFLRAVGSDPLNDLQSVHIFDGTGAGSLEIANNFSGPDASEIEVEITEILKKGDTSFGIEGLRFKFTDESAFARFDGEIDLEVVVKRDDKELATDKVKLKVAPFILLPNNRPFKEVWENGTGNLIPNSKHHDEIDPRDKDQWTQDMIEVGYTQAPGKEKHFVVLRLLHHSVVRVHEWPVKGLLESGTGVFNLISDPDMENSGDYGGNIEVMPPTKDWPLGRIVVGNTISPELLKFFQDQEVQMPLDIDNFDTSWLAVGHVDEMISFVGDGDSWSVVAADTALALSLLEPLPEDAVFFAVGDTTAGMSLKAEGGDKNKLIDNNVDFTSPEFKDKDFKYLRIYEGKGAGQVARILFFTKNEIMITGVFQTPTKVVMGPAGSDKPDFATCVADCIVEKPIRVSYGWIDEPDGTSKYVLVSDAKRWLTKVTGIDSNTLRGKGVPAIITVKEVLDDEVFKDRNEAAQKHIEDAVEAILDAADPDPTIIRVPDLYMWFLVKGVPYGVAFVPSLVNLQQVGDKFYFPEGFGPTNKDGKEIFEEEARKNMPGSNEIFVDDWDLFHRWMGEVHCGSYVIHEAFDFKWWEKLPESP